MIAALSFALAGCRQPGSPAAGAQHPAFERIGTIRAAGLTEISGIARTSSPAFVVQNDDGPGEVFVVATSGALHARIAITGAKQRDWEDLAVVPGPDGPLLVIGDIGDNHAGRSTSQLYFVPLPRPGVDGRYPQHLEVLHRISLRYPDGPRDSEALAYDGTARRLLLISKRDVPPRIYTIGTAEALSRSEAELQFVGELTRLRPPTPSDLARNPFRGPWVSQPTGLDISADGRYAAVITYRSLYLFRRENSEDWVAALQRDPVEYPGPPGTHDEAVTFTPTAGAIIVTTEGRPAPLYRIAVPDAAQSISTP